MLKIIAHWLKDDGNRVCGEGENPADAVALKNYAESSDDDDVDSDDDDGERTVNQRAVDEKKSISHKR